MYSRSLAERARLWLDVKEQWVLEEEEEEEEAFEWMYFHTFRLFCIGGYEKFNICARIKS